MSRALTLEVNGIAYDLHIDDTTSLLETLRRHVGLTGTKEGCDDSECGACMVLVDGRPVNSCSYLSVQAADRSVTTIEGIGASGRSALQEAMLNAGGVQCGFCTPGMVISATALLAREPDPSADQIRAALCGNLCRCTGYQKIVEAVAAAAAEARSSTAQH